MFGIDLDISKLVINFDKVEKVFIDGVVEQAEIRRAVPNSIALMIFSEKLEHVDDYGTMVRVSSITEQFEDEIIPLSDITMFDAGKKISQAFYEVFKHEIIDHNENLKAGIVTETTKNYPHEIDRDLELWVQVKPDQENKGNWKLYMNMIYNFKRLRPYDLRIEFKDIIKY